MGDRNYNNLIYDCSLSELHEKFKAWDEPGYRADQVWDGLYRQLWDNADAFSTLSKSLREKLGSNFSFSSLSPKLTLDSRDGETHKTLFSLPDGNAIEAVLMKYTRRRTLCISTQAGCAMGCVFCATGQMGFRRNLSSGEIIEQVLYYARILLAENDRPTNIVLMGMGEPFHNYDASLEAIDRLNDPKGFQFGARRFTVSTVGLIPAIRRFTQENRQVNLAISLHSVDDAVRSEMLPVNQSYPVADLLDACRDYVNHTGRRITFEWALIRDINDSLAEATALANRLQGLRCHVNVIPLNPTQGYPGKASPRKRAAAFKDMLEQNGISCTVRVRRGIDIHAGCGQLATASPSQ
jgi:23S rRNA (adenine2503-C2)-methyltransferase